MDLFGADRTLVMAVVNVTPDSFSDGGAWFAPDAALARARAMLADGADLLDIGGESTRPGSERVTAEEETARIIGVVEALAADGAILSIDTMNAATARACVEAGARIINDVSGGLHDPAMLSTVAELGVPYILQHTRGEPDTMTSLAQYDDVIADVVRELEQRVEAALAAGVLDENLILDPGLGFAKNGDQNWDVLAGLDALDALGFPVLVGASRKRFLADVVPDAVAGDARERDHATTSVTALLAAEGVWGVRVHEARPNRDAVEVGTAWRRAFERRLRGASFDGTPEGGVTEAGDD